MLQGALPGATIRSDQFVYSDASDPRKCLAPDVFVKLGAHVAFSRLTGGRNDADDLVAAAYLDRVCEDGRRRRSLSPDHRRRMRDDRPDVVVGYRAGG